LARTPSTMLALGRPPPRSACPISTDASTRSTTTRRSPHCWSHSSAVTVRSSGTCAGSSRRSRASTLRAASPSSRSTRTTSWPIPRRPDAMRAEAAELATVSVPARRVPGRRQGLPGGLHPRLLPVRRDRRLVYRGQFDDSRPGPSDPSPVRTCALRSMHCWPAPAHRGPAASLGCNIKWQRGNEPAYAAG